MQYSLVTIIALAATGVYARAVPQPLRGGGLGLPVFSDVDITKVTETVNKNTDTNAQKNTAANGQSAEQDAKAVSTGAEQTAKGSNSCTTKDGSTGSRLCCSPTGNTNSQSNSHTTTSTDADSSQTDISTVTELISFVEKNFLIKVQKVDGLGNSVSRRQSSAGSGGDSNSQGDVTCNMSDACSTEQKNVCFLNGNNVNLGPIGPLVFQKAPQDATSEAGTPPPAPAAEQQEATRRRRL